MDNQPTPTKRGLLATLMLWGIIVILAVVFLAGDAYLYSQWQHTKNELQATQAQLTTQTQRVRQLNAKLMEARDALRKKDVAQLARTIKAYNQSLNGHLTTEGSLSKQVYDTQLSRTITNFSDPLSGQTYGYVAIAPVQTPPPLKVGVMQYQWPGKCGASSIVDSADQSQSVVATLLEDGSMYCLTV